MADAAPQKDSETGRFLPGNTGFGGRPKGSRNKLGEAFVQALHDDFMQHGPETIETVRLEKPDQYLKVIASLLPKDVNLNINDTSEMTDDELAERVRTLAAHLSPFLSDGIGGAAKGVGDADGAALASRVH